MRASAEIEAQKKKHTRHLAKLAAQRPPEKAPTWWWRCATALRRCLGPPGAVEGWIELELTFEPLAQ